jgi:hypothetical protein
MKAMRCCLASVMALALSAGRARGEGQEDYYFAILSCHNKTDSPRTFAFLIRTTEQGKTLESQALSWPAVSERKGLESLQGERRKTVREVLEWAQASGARTTVYGPYPVRKGPHETLRSGIERELVGMGGDSAPPLRQSTANLLDADGDKRTNGSRSEANCLLAVRGLAPWLLPPSHAPDWLHERLELRKYGVELADAARGR